MPDVVLKNKQGQGVTYSGISTLHFYDTSGNTIAFNMSDDGSKKFEDYVEGKLSSLYDEYDDNVICSYAFCSQS